MRAGARRRARADDGAVVVEFALVLPVVMMLLLGMVSGATAWNQSQSLGSGVRVAGRYAATLPIPATSVEMATWLDTIAARAVSASEGAFGAGVAGRFICVAFVDPAGPDPDETFSRSTTGAAAPVSGTTPCFDDGQGETSRRVQVVLQRTGVLDIGFYRQPLEIRREVVYRYEADSGF